MQVETGARATAYFSGICRFRSSVFVELAEAQHRFAHEPEREENDYARHGDRQGNP
jgi:hypothetical protein